MPLSPRHHFVLNQQDHAFSDYLDDYLVPRSDGPVPHDPIQAIFIGSLFNSNNRVRSAR
jgi:hypothetical protein